MPQKSEKQSNQEDFFSMLNSQPKSSQSEDVVFASNISIEEMKATETLKENPPSESSVKEDKYPYDFLRWNSKDSDAQILLDLLKPISISNQERSEIYPTYWIDTQKKQLPIEVTAKMGNIFEKIYLHKGMTEDDIVEQLEKILSPLPQMKF